MPFLFARPLINSGRLSVPSVYDASPLNGADALDGPTRTRPGAPCPDAPMGNGFLLDHLTDGFTLLAIGTDAPRIDGIAPLEITDVSPELADRYLGDAPCALYLIRPDQHVAARWPAADRAAVMAAMQTALGGAQWPL